MAYIPMGSPSSVDPGMLRQQLMAQLLQGRQPADTLGGAVGQGLQTLAQGLGGRWQVAAAESAQQGQQQALIDMLGGKPGAPQMGATLPGDTGGLQGMTRGPATPGLLPGMDREQVLAMSLMPGGREALLQAAMQKMLPPDPEGYTLGEGELRYGPDNQLLASGPAGAPKPPQTRDVLQGDQRVFQQYDPATGQWAEVGRGPAFAPPSQVNVNTERAPSGYRFDESGALVPIPGGPAEQTQGSAAIAVSQGPGMIADIQDVTDGLLNPDGSVNQTNLATMNTPIVGSIPGTAGSELASKIAGIVANMLYIKSGATAGADEVATQARIYMPSPGDSAGAVRDKLARLDRDSRAIIMNYAKGARGDFGLPEVAIPEVGAEPGIGDRLLGGIVEKGRAMIGSGVDAVTGSPAAPAAAAPGVQEGATATNPATGEKLIYRGGQWVPI
jgi:hypothetical protein